MDELMGEGRGERQEMTNCLPALMEKDLLSQTSGLIRGLIHNINGPLHNLSMLGEMLINGHEQLDRLLDEQGIQLGESGLSLRVKQRDRLQRFMQQISALSEMLQDFSIIQELMTGSTDVDITFVLNKLAKVFRADLFFKHRVEVTLKLEENLPPVNIPGGALVPSLMHLIRNALLALSEASDKKLCIECSRNESLIRIAIRDTGIGFDPLHAERLFQLFYTGWPKEILERHELEGHFGLGLYVVRTLLQPYHVHLSLSREGTETVAALEIPLPEHL
jgi:signal transduction histidine kinase